MKIENIAGSIKEETRGDEELVGNNAVIVNMITNDKVFFVSPSLPVVKVALAENGPKPSLFSLATFTT